MAARKMNQIVSRARREMRPANEAQMKSPERMVVPLATVARMKLPGQMELRPQTDRNRPEIIHSVSKAVRAKLKLEMDNAAIAASSRTVIIMASRLRLEITAS